MNNRAKKAILGTVLVLGPGMIWQGYTNAVFSDQSVLGANTFETAETFATPTLSPSPTPTPTATPTPTPTPIPGLADHVVISEVQIKGDGSNSNDDEFVELYNPTSTPVVMTGWRLTRKNGPGTEANLVSTLNGTIPAKGYFLIVDAVGYNGGVVGDAVYSAASNEMTNNYTVLLYSDAQITLVDKLGLGSASDKEGTAFSSNPGANESVERKAYSTSTAITMNGIDATKGNGYDTDNNSTNFLLRTTSQPQNSSSPTETP